MGTQPKQPDILSEIRAEIGTCEHPHLLLCNPFFIGQNIGLNFVTCERSLNGSWQQEWSLEAILYSGRQADSFVNRAVTVCLHCPTPIPMPIQRLIPMELGVIVFLRRVYSGSMRILIRMQMGTVPNLTQILVLIRWVFKYFS